MWETNKFYQCYAVEDAHLDPGDLSKCRSVIDPDPKNCCKDTLYASKTPDCASQRRVQLRAV